MAVPKANLFTNPAAAAKAVEVPGNSPFLLRFHPDLWELVTLTPATPRGKAQVVLIPQLAKDVLQPGVNGVHQETDERSGAECYAGLVDRQRRRGWKYLSEDIIVPAEFLPEGVSPGPPVRKVRGKGGTYHHEAWERVEVDSLMGGVNKTYHKQGLYQWLWSLAKDGAFGVPTPRALTSLRRQISMRREELRTSSRMTPTLRDEKVNAIDARVILLEKAAATLGKVTPDA